MRHRDWTHRDLAYYQDDHYRSSGAQWIADGQGHLVVVQPFEVYQAGAWEPFLVELDRRQTPGRN
jgi:hypothetical protein